MNLLSFLYITIAFPRLILNMSLFFSNKFQHNIMREKMTMVIFFLAIMTISMCEGAMDYQHLRQMVIKHNVTCVLVFGDSSVDPGNNNYLNLALKSNFPPYGKDFFRGQPTGRFSNGRLATDFIVDALGLTSLVQPFLDHNISKVELLHGISFASAGSGYDDLTANLTNALPVSRQLEYFRHYKIRLRKMLGEIETEKIIRNAIVVISMGTNDFLQNYYLEPTRSKQFTVEQYQDYLISSLNQTIKALYRTGVRKVAVVGLPSIGCIPIVKTIKALSKCDDEYNKVASTYNSKIIRTLETMESSLQIQTTYIDIFNVIESAVNNPGRYGFTETSKGCCGSGMLEFGDSCKGTISTCADPTKYVFWDAIHPTEKMYQIVAIEALKSISETMLN